MNDVIKPMPIEQINAMPEAAGWWPAGVTARIVRLLRAVEKAAVAAERERLCAAIKAADDKASEGDYMLDSDDCISVIRGTWNPWA